MDRTYKTITALPAWAAALANGELSPGNLDRIAGTPEAYTYVPMIYRALRIRCDSLSAVPVIIEQTGKEIDWPFKTPIRRLIWKTEASLLFKGAAYWVRRSQGARLLDAQWLNPFTVNIDYDAKSEQRTFTQQIQGQIQGTWTEDQITYFSEFNPIDDINPGPGAVQVALANARLMHYLTRFAATFFEGGAMPILLLTGLPGADKAEVERVENFFRRFATGLKNAFRVLGLRGDVKATPVTQNFKDMVLSDLMTQARQEVANAFSLHQSLLEMAANFATAQEHRRSFYEDTVKARAAIFEDTINSQFLAGTNLKIRFDFESMSIYQEDESSRAGSLSQLVTSGVPLLVAMDILGYSLTAEQRQAIEDAESAALEAANAPTPAAGNLPGAAQQPGAGNLPGAPGPMPWPMAPEQQPPSTRQARTELEIWQRRSIKNLLAGKGAAIPFLAEAIPGGLAKRIEGSLQDAKTAEDIKSIFDQAQDVLTEEEPARNSLDALLVEWRRSNEILEKTNN